ncbi:MAG: hypothetical protein WHV26_07905 [Spirochaetota bacterium]
MFALPSQIAINYYIKFIELNKHYYLSKEVYSYYACQSFKYFILLKIAWLSFVMYLYPGKLKLKNPDIVLKINSLGKSFLRYTKKMLFLIFMVIVCSPILAGIVLILEWIVNMFGS